MMNATKGEGRSLRERKPVNYNITALELGQYSDDDEKPKNSRGKQRRSAEHWAAKNVWQVLESSPSGSSSPEQTGIDSQEDEMEVPKYKENASRRQAMKPERTQPSRLASAAAKDLKEASFSEDSSSEAIEDDEENDEEEVEEEEEEESSDTRRPKRTKVSSGREVRRTARSNAANTVNLAEDSSNDNEIDGNSSDEDANDSDKLADDQSHSKEETGRRSAKQAARRTRAANGISKTAMKRLDLEEDEYEQPKKKPRVMYSSIAKVLDRRESPEDGEEFFVSFETKSYRKCAWVPGKKLRETQRSMRMIRSFFARQQKEQDPDLVNGILLEWLQVERIIGIHTYPKGVQYLTKWCGLPYTDATWEDEEDLADDQKHIKQYKQREAAKHDLEKRKFSDKDKVPDFLNGRTLRDYQVDSLKWMVANLVGQRSCILGDEMGLGKTAQSIAVLEYQRQILGVRGPFLVVAPLTTLGHWNREIITWTGMNVVQYTGSKEDREMIREYEFEFETPRRAKEVKFDILLTSYEILLMDKAIFGKFGYKWPKFQTVIVDEAHRLKTLRSSTREVVQELDCKWLLLLTGTPVQNNMRELFGIMNLVNCQEWADEEDFYKRYGGDAKPPTVEQIQALQAELRPILLRRMKEDVEQLPEKEEVIVWVELTRQQQFYYKALYSQQIGALLAGASSKNLPNLRNLAMELRKVCCHPYLCNGLEDDIADRHREMGAAGDTELGRMVNASGKMVLLHKLLPKLRAEGRKVLIFSQFKIMLNVIEDSLNLCQYPFERIDGSVAARERQVAIDRFTKGGDDTFVFLLSTKAGGQGITLTAADTVIIYDSDWNPQNDLQAMARCHRIGQSKDVTVYRLICKNTYEQTVFNIASRKYGLDEAILGSMNSDNPEQNSAQIAELLKHGAHSLVGKEDVKSKEGEAFANEDIAEILAQRTEKRQIGSRAGNTFSTAQFTADAPGVDANGNERDYWAALMPDDVDAYEKKLKAGPTPLGPRKRSRVNYADSPAKQAALAKMRGPSPSKQDDTYSGSVMSEPSNDDDDEEELEGESGRRTSKNHSRAAGNEWSKAQIKRLTDTIVAFGPSHFHDIRPKAGLEDKSKEEVKAVVEMLSKLIEKAAFQASIRQDLKSQVKLDEADLKTMCEINHLSGHLDEHIASLKTRLAALKKRYEKVMQQELISSDLEIPTVASKATKGLAQQFLASGMRYSGLLQERKVLRDLLMGLSAQGKADQRFLMVLHKKKNALKDLPLWWSVEHDLALLVGSFRIGLTSHSVRASVESMLRDPHNPLYMILKGPGAQSLAAMEPTEVDVKNIVGPDLISRLPELIHPRFRNQSTLQTVDELKDELKYRTTLHAMAVRLKALLKHMVAEESLLEGIRLDEVGNNEYEEENSMDEGSDEEQPDEAYRLKAAAARPEAARPAPAQPALAQPAKAPKSATMKPPLHSKKTLSVNGGGVVKMVHNPKPTNGTGVKKTSPASASKRLQSSGGVSNASPRAKLLVRQTPTRSSPRRQTNQENSAKLANQATLPSRLAAGISVIDLTTDTDSPGRESKPRAAEKPRPASATVPAKQHAPAQKASKMKQSMLSKFSKPKP